jgi:tetratricopeptide (TPR) repeat protein
MTLPEVRRPGRIALFLILLGTAWTCWLLADAWKANAGPGFPLDDPWIHLQFARNLHDTGTYSFNRNEAVTAGSTSPLYTVMLAAGFSLTSDEMILSYSLGLFFFAVAAFFFFRLCLRLFPGSPALALTGLVLFLLEPRMQWAALSGMETTLFIAGMLACFYYFASGRWNLLALSCGMLLWVRPEALLLLLTLAIGALMANLRDSASGENVAANLFIRSLWRRTRMPLGILAVCVVPYLLMNLIFSGTLLPNSVAAKLGYYYPEQGAFFSDLGEFLGGHHFLVVAPLALAGCVVAVRETMNRQDTSRLVLLVWCAGMILTFGLKLPYLYQQGRYLMPVIPPVLILALTGGSAAIDLLRRRWEQTGRNRGAALALSGALALMVVVQFIFRDSALAREYAGACGHVRDLQVVTARWIRENTPADAVVATHDIGAIGYYSGRRIVDIAGLVDPGFIPFVRQLDSLPSYLVRKHVTHLAVLRNWYEVVNVNPVFRRGNPDDELMEVFPFDASRIHFVRPEAVNAVGQGLAFLRKGDIARAGVILESAVNLDPLSSRSHLSLGLARQAVGQRKRAEESFRTAIALQPDLWSAQIALAQLEAEQGRAEDGISRLRRVIAMKPDLGAASTLLADMVTRWKADSLASQKVLGESPRRKQKGRGD